MSEPGDRRYTKDHEWAKNEAQGVRVGITAYAQAELGDVVFVDLPEVGAVVEKGQSFATVESVKAVSDIYAPITGTVVAVNEALVKQPETVNHSPYEDGWMAIMEANDNSELDTLLSAEKYSQFVAEISK